MFSRSCSKSFRADLFAVMAAILTLLSMTPRAAMADTLSDLFGAPYDRIEVLEAGDSSFASGDTSTYDDDACADDEASMDGEDSFASSEDDIMLLSASGGSISPRAMSGEMLYFCKWESANYDQGLSSGDYYHAMGYFQFDNRYDLGSFLYAVYSYNPSKYSALKVIGDTYRWDVSGTTYSNGSFTSLGNALNSAWHACYSADPTEFSNLQNDWAYTQYYSASDGIVGSLKAMGIDVDGRSDSVKSLVWGMANLFGKGGGKSYVEQGFYYGANWFIKNSGVTGSMDDETFVTVLCDYIVNNVASRYPNQSQYWNGWQNRYRDEKSHYLEVIQNDEVYKRQALDELAEDNRDVIADGTYVVRALCSSRSALDVPGGSAARGANVQIWESNGADAQKWVVSHDEKGYLTLEHVGTGMVLDVCGASDAVGTNVWQWSKIDGSYGQKWVAVPSGDGGYTLVSALNPRRCLDVAGGGSSNGTDVRIWEANGAAAQRFEFESTVPVRQALDELAEDNRDVIADGTYVVRALCSSRSALDVPGGSAARGANVQIWESNGADAQKWVVSHDEKGYLTLEHVGTGMVLDVCGASDAVGTNVWQWSKIDGSYGQKWVAVPSGDGGYTLVSALNPRRCLDVAGGGSSNGTDVRIWEANGAAAQRFEFVNTEPSVEPAERGIVKEGVWYSLIPTCAPANSLDIEGGSLVDGANVRSWTSNSEMAQLFSFFWNDGYYQILNAASGKALTVSGCDVVDGANVCQRVANAENDAQLFSVLVNADGTVTIVNKGTGLALDVLGVSSQCGANVDAWSLNYSAAQRFSLKQYDHAIKEGIYLLAAASNTSEVADVMRVSTEDGVGVNLWHVTNGFNQRWLITPVEGFSDTYTIESLNSGKRLASSAGSVVQSTADDSNCQQWKARFDSNGICFESVSNPGMVIDMAAGSTADGTLIRLWANNGATAQRWRLIRSDDTVPDGCYYIRMISDSNQVLDVARESLDDGANVWAWHKAGSGNQKWFVTRFSDGSYSIVNALSGKALEVAGGIAQPGRNVQQWAKNGSACQRWRLEYRQGGYRLVSLLDSSLVLEVENASTYDCANVRVANGSGFSFEGTTYIPPVQQAMVWKAQSFYSSTSWLVLVDTTQNNVGVFHGSRGNWSLVNFWKCSSGAAGTPTVLGEYSVGNRGYSFGSGYTCYYWTQFYGSYLFHSVLYYENSSTIMDGRIGQNLSHGCVRLDISNAKWIYDNIPRGSKVVTYR